MYNHLFNDICFKEVNIGDILKFRNMIDLPMMVEKFPKASNQDMVNSMAQGRKVNSELLWLEYHSDPTLSIFSGLHILYPQMCKEIIDQVNSSLEIDLPVWAVTLATTSRSCHIHSDYYIRYGSLNCYLENAELAVTNFYNTEQTEIIDSLHAVTGKSYLLNVSRPHQVIQQPSQEKRVFLTISFFDKNYLKNFT
jgi:hypothetical protein